jgi:hypothetical protein
MPINLANWKTDYVAGTSANSEKLVREYTNKTGKIEAATSSTAQKNYEDAMRDPKVLARRVSGLRKLSESDLNAGMTAKGASRYREGTAAAADRAAAAFAPVAAVIDSTVSALPARVRDGYQNLVNRAGPIVKNLQAFKEKGG